MEKDDAASATPEEAELLSFLTQCAIDKVFNCRCAGSSSDAGVIETAVLVPQRLQQFVKRLPTQEPVKLGSIIVH